jgi:tetratricopeptide (TPR) repeat protein
MASPERVIRYEFHDDFVAIVASRRVLKNGKPLASPLAPLEFAVLEFFLENRGKVVDRWSVKPLLRRNAPRSPTDDYLSRVAKKLGVRRDEIFRTIRNVGYTFVANVRPINASDEQKGGDIFKASEHNFNTHTIHSMRLSLQQSLQALKLNPKGLPEAHVTVAFDYINLGMAAYAAEIPLQVIPKARRHATVAFAADPKSSRALGVLGLISMIFDYDWEDAKRQLEGALKLNPKDSATWLSYAHYLIGSGRLAEAIKAAEAASRIDPVDLIIHASVGWIHLLAGDVKGAIKHGKVTTSSFYPDFPPAHVILGWAYEAAHQFDRALEHYRTSLEKEYSPAALASLGHLEAKLGNHAAGYSALKELEDLFKWGKISYVPGYSKALILAGIGEVDGCLDALEEAYLQRCDWLIHLGVERRWDSLRRLERFQRLVDRVGIASDRGSERPRGSARKK